MSVIRSLLSRCASKNFLIHTTVENSASKLIVRIQSRAYASDGDLPPVEKFPSFSTKGEKKPGTNFDGYNPNPALSVFVNTMLKGVEERNLNNLPANVLEKLGQTPIELLTGASYAIGAVTGEISSQRLDLPEKSDSDDNDILRNCLTPECLYRLRNCYLSMEDLRDKHYLVRTNKDDIFFSWINRLSIDEYGSTHMQVCTMSFPQHGFLIQKRDEVQEQQKKIIEEYKAIRIKTRPTREELDELKKKYTQYPKVFVDGFRSPREFIRHHNVIASNFFFKRGPDPDDPWLIDEIMMKDTTEVFSTLKCLRWKGRLAFSLMGVSWRMIFLMDWIYLGSMTALIGSII